MKKTLALILTLVIGLTLVACGNSKNTTPKTSGSKEGLENAESNNVNQSDAAKKTTEVVFWHSLSGTVGDELQAIVDEYNEGQGAKKGIHVNAVYQGYEGTDKVILAYQTQDVENACDINVGLTSTIPSMVNLDWTTSVSEMMKKYDSEVTADNFYESMVRSVTYEDEMVALPFLNSTMVMYYNVDALKEAGLGTEAPKTMDEMAEYVKALTLTDESGNVTRYGLECQVKRYQMVNFCVSQSENAFFGDKEGGRAGAMTKLVCDEDGTLRNFLEKWNNIIVTGGYQYVENNISEEFATGSTAMAIMSSSKCTNVNELVGDSFQWATAPIAKVNADDTSGAAVGGSCLVLFDRGDEARLAGAWDFMQYLSSEDSQYRISTKSGYIPTNKATEELTEMNSFYAVNPEYKTALDVIKTSSPMAQEPMDLCYNEINTVITDVMLQFCEGRLSVDETVDKIVSQSNQLLDEWHEAND